MGGMFKNSTQTTAKDIDEVVSHLLAEGKLEYAQHVLNLRAALDNIGVEAGVIK